ncbi:MAG: aminoglycoside phosphotransferase family protein, partial [Planctomycetota bacterium]
MSSALPYGIDSWYPVLRGGASPSVFIDGRGAQAGAELEAAWDALPEGGRLVVQAVASPGSKPKATDLERSMRAEGTEERFVSFPGTGGSFTLLPARDGAALRGGMPLLPSGRARGRALWALLRAASPFGIAQRLGRPEVTVWTKGTRTQDAENLAVLPVAGSIAVAGGVPDRNQKIIVRALDRRGAARAILKLGFSERTDDAVSREARALEQIAEILDDRAPRLLDQGHRAGRTWLAQEVLEGSHAGDELTPQHASLLAELGVASRSETVLEELPFFQDSLRNLCSLDPAYDPDWHQEYAALVDALEGAAGGAPVPTSIAHGDFTPWNVLGKRGQIRAFDWEYFAHEAPALNDVLHFRIQTG